jgi:hypothetical protein
MTTQPSLVERLQAIVRQHTEPWVEWVIELTHDVSQDAITFLRGEPTR